MAGNVKYHQALQAGYQTERVHPPPSYWSQCALGDHKSSETNWWHLALHGFDVDKARCSFLSHQGAFAWLCEKISLSCHWLLRLIVQAQWWWVQWEWFEQLWWHLILLATALNCSEMAWTVMISLNQRGKGQWWWQQSWILKCCVENDTYLHADIRVLDDGWMIGWWMND